MCYLQAGQVQVQAQVIWAAADVAGLAVPPGQAASKGVRLGTGAKKGRKAAAAALQGLPGARRDVVLAQAL